jgi:1,4-alpha-glucan branching enzyme
MTDRFGPAFIDTNLVEFRVFAPKAKRLTLQLEDMRFAMLPDEDDGFFTLKKEASAGMKYGYQVNDGPYYPDPASRFQLDGVHKSELIDLSCLEKKTRTGKISSAKISLSTNCILGRSLTKAPTSPRLNASMI